MPKCEDVCRTARFASKLSYVSFPFIKQNFLNPRNVGVIDGPDGRGEGSSLVCGALVRITLRIDAEKKITDAKFKAVGCQLLVASASLLTETIKGKSTAQAAQIAKDESANQCAALCHDALLSAITFYSDAMREEWTGEEALICTCFGVSESAIEKEVGSASLHTIEEVTEACKAGAGCRSCYPLIQEILDVHWREQV
jgi:NifU-like protein